MTFLGMVTMHNKNLYSFHTSRKIVFFSFLLVCLMGTLPVVLAQELLKDIEPSQIKLIDKLDVSYKINSTGSYHRELKQLDPIVWIDSYELDDNGYRNYHVDSRKTFSQDENITIDFYYDVQPDWIKHINHDGVHVKTYFPSEWNWDNGTLSLVVDGIVQGYGSSTFPIGVTGPTWASEGDFYGEFDSSSSQVNGVDSVTLDIVNEITLSVWAKPLDVSKNRIFNKKWTYAIYTESDDVKFLIYNSTNNGNILTSTDSVSVDSWFNIVGVCNGSNLTIYVDGDFKVSSIMSQVDSIRNSTYDYFVGGIGGSELWNGSIDELRVYNKSLTLTQIIEINNSGRTANSSLYDNGNLMLWIDFDDYSVEDKSSNSNHGTNTNVTFGEVSRDMRTLTLDKHYSISGHTDPPSFVALLSEIYYTPLNLTFTAMYEAYTPSYHDFNFVLERSKFKPSKAFDSEKIPKKDELIDFSKNVLDESKEFLTESVEESLDEGKEIVEDVKNVKSWESFIKFLANHYLGILVIIMFFIFLAVLSFRRGGKKK